MADGLYLGSDLGTGERAELEADHLTTHAVCLGMTGSGKTGLGIVALEELARRRVPLLVLDLKGDMVNLLLSFPDLSPEAFEPWLPSDAVAGRDRDQVAVEQAALWRRGLAGSGLGEADVRAVVDGLEWQLLTPGVASAAPVDILPALSAPAGWHPDSDLDGATDRVNGISAALLSLIDRGGDPLADPDSVLVASIILEHWRRADRLDLPMLLGSIANPPIDKLGALPLETFYPRARRMQLVMALNTLLASPAFVAWTRGAPLTMETLLGTPENPRASVVALAHLDERQRLFVMALLLSELVAWMRRQGASARLRALLYVDEVQGILPPHPHNPPTKGPLLTLLKQGRAFGVGAWLSTQNPVDLDYKALGNAGVKLIGRLITERDRERALEGLGVGKSIDGRDVEDLVTGLGKRQFVLYDVRAKKRMRTFSSRWAMSYLRGPVTLVEMEPLLGRGGDAVPADWPGPTPPAFKKPVTADAASRPPVMASGVEARFAVAGEGLAWPMLQVRNRLTLERKSLGLYRREQEVWQVPVDARGELEWLAAEAVDAPLEVDEKPPAGMRFPPAAPARLDREMAKAARSFVTWRARQPVVVVGNTRLKLAAAPGESREVFLGRCLERADRADDAAQERVRARFERRMQTLRNRVERERDELERDRAQLASRKIEEKLGMVEGLFSVLLGSRSLRSAAGKAAAKTRSAATRRRMRQRAEASVVESEREIERLSDDLEDLADELQDEIDRIAAESEARAEAIQEVAIRPKKADVELLDIELVWVVQT